MRKLITFGILLILFSLTLNYKEQILDIYNKKIPHKANTVTLGEKNSYYRDYDFTFVQNTDNFKPMNRQDLLNIFYTAINAGKDSFTFYCPKEYQECSDEVVAISKDQVTLSNINNYVHPFNSFKNISTETDTLGKITIKITKAYSDEDINSINIAINNVKKQIINNNLSTEDQLKVIHDYIINHSMYDSNRTDNGVIEYKSDLAYGPLIQGYGICGGYSDLFELFLEELNIKSFKVSSDSHIWNAVNLYDSWYHYDLTWDDPVTDTNEQILEDNFLKLTTNELLSIENTQHNFDTNYYQELA